MAEQVIVKSDAEMDALATEKASKRFLIAAEKSKSRTIKLPK